MRFEIQSYILHGGRGREKMTEDQLRCPVCGGERRDDRRMVPVAIPVDLPVKGTAQTAELCRDLWHEPKVVERSAHITLDTNIGA